MLSTHNHTENKEEKTLGRILMGCIVMKDGMGDLGHFMDIIKEISPVLILKQYKPLYLLIDQNGERIDKFKEVLKDNGFDIALIHIISGKNKHALSDYIDSQPDFRNALRQVKGMFNISSWILDLYASADMSALALRKFFYSNFMTVPCISILEHGIKGAAIGGVPHQFYSMGFNSNNVIDGLLIKDIKRDSSPAEKLLGIQNKNFLAHLLHNQTEEKEQKQISLEHANSFLKKSLLIPAYFQFTDDPEHFVKIINAVSKSELASKYQEIVFVINNGNLLFPLKRYGNLLADNISSIQFSGQRKEGDKKFVAKIIPNSNKVTGQCKNVRAISGVWFNKKDYDALHDCAQIFGGCSGDKSIEKDFEYMLIPLLNVQLWKYGLIKNFVDYANRALASANIPTDHNLVANFLDVMCKLYEDDAEAKLTSLLTTELLKQWQILFIDIKTNHNFYSHLSQIALELITMIRKHKHALNNKKIRSSSLFFSGEQDSMDCEPSERSSNSLKH